MERRRAGAGTAGAVSFITLFPPPLLTSAIPRHKRTCKNSSLQSFLLTKSHQNSLHDSSRVRSSLVVKDTLTSHGHTHANTHMCTLHVALGPPCVPPFSRLT